jgi:hypothetical protein
MGRQQRDIQTGLAVHRDGDPNVDPMARRYPAGYDNGAPMDEFATITDKYDADYLAKGLASLEAINVFALTLHR